MNCNATLTTATVEPCRLGDPTDDRTWHSSTPEFACDGRQHVTLHTLTCENEATQCRKPDVGGEFWMEHVDDGVTWFDSTPGAKPHVDPEPPLVTDEEVEAAAGALFHTAAADGVGAERPSEMEVVARAALEAAARIRRQ